MSIIHKLGDAGILGSIAGPDGRGQWSADLGQGQVLAFGPAGDGGRAGWNWTWYQHGEVTADGREGTDEDMVRLARGALEGAGRIYHG
jgi:hypothetical protein